MSGVISHLIEATKAATIFDSSWKFVGGGAIIFHAIKTYIFGKTIRTMEYPDGDLITLSIRRNTIGALQNCIIKAQTPIYPGVVLDASFIKTIALWTPPSFTEEIKTSKDMKRIQEGSWVLWSRTLDKIPTRNVTLTPEAEQNTPNSPYISDSAIRFVQKLSNSKSEDEYIPPNIADTLVDLIIDNDQSVHTIYRNFKDNPKSFKKYSFRLLTKRQLIPPQPRA